MKKFILLTLISIFSFTLIGCKKQSYLDGSFAVVYQDDVPYLINKNFETYSLAEYDYIVPEFNEYLVVGIGNGDNRKYGFIKNTGEEIIKPKYASATIFSENKAIVELNNQLMIINPQNEVLYTFPDNMHSSKLYSEDMLVVEVDNKYTYLTSTFDTANKSYDYAGSFVNGYAVVGNLSGNSMKYGLIDQNFNVVIDLNYDFLDNYYDGFVRVGTIIDAKNNQYNYQFMRLDGSYLRNSNDQVLTVDYALNFSNGYALIADYKTEDTFGTFKAYKYIDTDGNTPFIFNFKRSGEGLYYFDNLIKSGDTNTLVGRYRYKVDGAGVWYVLELYDGVLEEIPYTIPEKFQDNKNYWRFTTPYEMTNFKFNSFYGDSSPLARVRIYTGEYGLVDSTGTYVLPAEYSFLFY